MADLLKIQIVGNDEDGYSWGIICDGSADGLKFNRSFLVGKTGYSEKSVAEWDANEALQTLRYAVDTTPFSINQKAESAEGWIDWRPTHQVIGKRGFWEFYISKVEDDDSWECFQFTSVGGGGGPDPIYYDTLEEAMRACEKLASENPDGMWPGLRKRAE